MAEEVARIAVDHYSVLMENHGVIVWGKDVEDAQWKMENTDAYCQVIWIASLGCFPYCGTQERYSGSQEFIPGAQEETNPLFVYTPL